jgi:tetratricopeptide (TPR) repeat protein
METRFRYYQEKEDKYGMVYALAELKNIYTLIGDWKRVTEIMDQALPYLLVDGKNAYLEMKLYADRPWSFLGTGRFAEAERHLRQAIHYVEQIGDENSLTFLYRNIGLVLAHQENYEEALKYLDKSIRKYRQRGDYGGAGEGIVSGYSGITLVWKGALQRGRDFLVQSLAQKQNSKDLLGIPQILNWLGEAHEKEAKKAVGDSKASELTKADSYYCQSLDYRWTGRSYYQCAALTGLIRVKYAQGDLEALPPLLSEAQQLAQPYEYNDLLASLSLTQGQVSPLFEEIKDFAELEYFKKAMIYALRYNRFLLDEVLNGRLNGTPLHPIIPYCLERGEEGRNMLVFLREWWQTGTNSLGIPESATISPIPPGISLLQAEHLAREREPGNGTLQTDVVEQIDAVL